MPAGTPDVGNPVLPAAAANRTAYQNVGEPPRQTPTCGGSAPTAKTSMEPAGNGKPLEKRLMTGGIRLANVNEILLRRGARSDNGQDSTV